MFNFPKSRRRPLSLAGNEMQATVVDNNDPLKSERIKLRIKGLHDKIADKDLPWTIPNRSGQANSSSGTGSVGNIPQIGAKVNSTYSDDTMYHGRYSSGTPQKDTRPEELAANDTTGKNYPHVESEIKSDGTRITHDKKQGRMDIEHPSGTHMSIDGKGHVSLRTASKKQGDTHSDKHSSGLNLHLTGDANILATGTVAIGGTAKVIVISQGDLTLAAKGNVNIVADGNVNIQGANIHENLGGLSVPDMPKVTPQTARSVPKAEKPADPTSSR